MSDYGHDPTYGWYEDSSDASTYDPLMVDNIGGTPFAGSERLLFTGVYLAAGNNPYTHIQLFYNSGETVVPPVNATQYTNNASGFTKIITNTSNSNSTTTELNDNYATGINGYSTLGNGATDFTWNSGGYVNYSTDRSSTFSALSKQFTESAALLSGRSHQGDLGLFSIASTSVSAAALFGFRNSATTTLGDAISLVVLNQTPSIRVDYNGQPFSTGNRSLTQFTTTLALNTTYQFSLDMNNSVVTGTLMRATGTVLGTETVNISGSEGFDGVDSFGLNNYADGLGEPSRGRSNGHLRQLERLCVGAMDTRIPSTGCRRARGRYHSRELFCARNCFWHME